MGLFMACSLGLYGILGGLTKSTVHPSQKQFSVMEDLLACALHQCSYLYMYTYISICANAAINVFLRYGMLEVCETMAI